MVNALSTLAPSRMHSRQGRRCRNDSSLFQLLFHTSFSKPSNLHISWTAHGNVLFDPHKQDSHKLHRSWSIMYVTCYSREPRVRHAFLRILGRTCNLFSGVYVQYLQTAVIPPRKNTLSFDTTDLTKFERIILFCICDWASASHDFTCRTTGRACPLTPPHTMSRPSAQASRSSFASKTAWDALAVESGEESEEEQV